MKLFCAMIEYVRHIILRFVNIMMRVGKPFLPKNHLINIKLYLGGLMILKATLVYTSLA